MCTFVRFVPLWLRIFVYSLLFAAASTALAEGGPAPGEWRSYGADSASTKYSPLDQINASNLDKVKVVWTWKSIDEPFAAEVSKKFQRARISGLKVTPLMVDGVLYVATPLYQAAAIDAATGKTIWQYNPKSYEQAMPAMSMGFNQRGCAYWSDGKEARILWGTGDGYLIAVDAKTGQPCSGFGESGKVDLAAGIQYAERDRRDDKGRWFYSVASPPLVCRDVVVVPCSISDDPVNKEMPAGHIRGFDVRTGKMLWTFHTVPQPGEFGNETWEDGSWKYSGNTNCWTQMSADDELGYFYIPIGEATGDFYGGTRKGDNLFAECIVCLDAKTGKRVWHFQMVHHGVYDYDPPCAPNLVDITVDGKKIKAVAQVTKFGFTYVFDRVTGKPVWPIEERPVPPTDFPGEKTSPTQPFPTKPPAHEPQGIAESDLIDFTPALHAEAMEIIKEYRTGPLFTPPSVVDNSPGGRKGTILNPGWGGGANWTGAAVDPETGFLYIPSSTGPIAPDMALGDPAKGNLPYMRRGIPGIRGPQGLPLLKPPYSRITAIDLNKGTIAWQSAHGLGGSRIKNNPALKGVNLPPLGTGGKSGPLVTKTLLFVAQRGEPGSSDPDEAPALLAYDKATGKVVGKIPLPASAMGTPMTYMLKGKQYIALTILTNTPELVAMGVE